MEEDKVTQAAEEKQTKKPPKMFTILQSILLLVLSLVITSGGGYALGNYFFWEDIDMKRVNEQYDHYKEQVRIDPSNLEYRIILGYTNYLKGNNDDAIREFMYVLDQDENYFDAHYNLGLVYLEEERYNEALTSFNKSAQVAPKDYKGHLQMGVTYRHLEMYEEAKVSLEKANQLTPGNSDIIFQIGLVVEAQGDFELAVEVYKDALQYDPLYEEAVVALDRLKDYDTGIEGE